jgi:hypothetical protein
MITSNTFVRVGFDAGVLRSWASDLPALAALLAPVGSTSPIDTGHLLRWFGASPERIMLLAYAGNTVMPTHVGRDMCIGSFRSDFAWATIERPFAPTIGFIALAGGHAAERGEPRGPGVDGVGQRVGRQVRRGALQVRDWCAGPREEARPPAAMSGLLGANFADASYVFSLIADEQGSAGGYLQRGPVWSPYDRVPVDAAQALTFARVCELGTIKLAAFGAVGEGRA